MYAEIRDKNFNAVGPYLSRKAKALSAQDEKRKTANTVRELKTFVEMMPQLMAMKQSLATHTSIAEQVNEDFVYSLLIYVIAMFISCLFMLVQCL